MARSQTGSNESKSPFGADFLAAVRRRERDAMNGFFDHFYDRIFGYVCHLLHDRNLAADLTQDAFLRIHRNLDRLDPQRDPTAWVFTIAVNTVRDHWRSRQHKTDTQRQAAKPVEELPLTDERPRVDEQLETADEATAVREALSDLSDDDREIILLRNYENLETATIADLLDIRPDNVRQRHSRAVSRLGRAYKARQTDSREQP